MVTSKQLVLVNDMYWQLEKGFLLDGSDMSPPLSSLLLSLSASD